MLPHLGGVFAANKAPRFEAAGQTVTNNLSQNGLGRNRDRPRKRAVPEIGHTIPGCEVEAAPAPRHGPCAEEAPAAEDRGAWTM